jgi:pimeloyl-ACP methyl ester carboxylesterase
VWRVATSVYRGARKVIGDPRVTSVLQAGPNVVSFVARARARSAAAVDDVTVVKTKTTPALVAQAYLDEILLAVFRHPGLLPQAHDYTVAASDVMAFRDLCAQRGWLEDPTAYHRDPLPPDDVVARHERRVVLSYEHTTFTSGWEPHEGEGGRDRWLRHTANRTTHAWVARAPGPDSGSWVVCAHGFGMGTNALMDLQAFRVAQLHRRGINVVVPVLPLHGPRASGRVRGEDFMTIDMVDSVHGIAQAAWDLRRVIRWLRATQGARHVGVIGYSLGGLVASVVGALEDDLACVIAGIPVVDLPQLFRRHMPARMARLAVDEGALGPAADDAHRVVSPLAMSCRVPFERRFVFAGLADRLSTFGQARRLWLHWGQPAFAPYPGGHMGFYWSADVKRFVDEALAASYPAAAA